MSVSHWGQILSGGVEASAGIARLKARLHAHNHRIGWDPPAESCPQVVTLPDPLWQIRPGYDIMLGMSFLTHLECPECERDFPADVVQNLCPCGAPLFARYEDRKSVV